jgi:hypothetical protein
MALVSPGVEVNVIDESFYTPATAGTVPMLFVATAENKANSSGTGIAPGTQKNNAGVPYLLTSQRDLAELFGDPIFQVDNNNNPVHGSEINEYGLQTAYSALGVTNQAWVVRADIDLAALEPTPNEPEGEPLNGTYWLDAAATKAGIFEWNGAPVTEGGQKFVAKTPIVITSDLDYTFGTVAVNGTAGNVPKGSVGTVGSYALVFASTVIRLFYKNAQGTWVLVGSDQWKNSFPAVTSNAFVGAIGIDGNFEINGTQIDVVEEDTLEDIADKITGLSGPAGINASVVGARLEIYSDGTSFSPDGSSLTGDVRFGLFSEPSLATLLGFTPESVHEAPSLQISKHTQVPRFKATDPEPKPTGSVWIKTTEPGGGARWRMKVYNDATQLWQDIDAPLYETAQEALFELDRVGGGTNIPAGAVYVSYNVAEDDLPLATFKVFRRNGVFPTTFTTPSVSTLPEGVYEIQLFATQPGTAEVPSYTVRFEVDAPTVENGQEIAEIFANSVNSSGITGLQASVDSNARITLSHATGGDIRLLDDAENPVLNQLGFSTQAGPNIYFAPGTTGDTTPLEYQISLWNPNNAGNDNAFYIPAVDEVSTLTADGALWYNSIIDEVDLMIHDGSTWVGYKNFTDYDGTNENGPIISASTPLQQENGNDLVTGDIWIDTSDIENFPKIYRYNADLQNTAVANRWVLLDNADQSSEDGVLFADARYSNNGGTTDGPYPEASILELLESDYLDPDAPDPALYPRGMILWNTRRSGFNVKRFVRNYIDTTQDNIRQDDVSMENYYPHRWVTESGNQADGSGSFGRKAQRKVVVQALQATLNSSEAIRDTESRRFNLMATPGYPELIGEMITLNYDRSLSAFIIGDTPARLTPDGTTLNNWATNVNNAVEDNLNGLVSRDEYLGIFYPYGFTSDNFGNNVVVPPSHMILRTIILSDQVSYPWFAPAGTRRGGITNATSVGYIDSEGEFVSTVLNEGQRDILYQNNINPVTFLSGSGLVNYGQKTRARGASALDRINVARLVVYLRERLNDLAKPYIFEQNDKITRDEIKQAAESLLLELTGQRALYDFLVVCDETNNTPSRIDRNELYLDIAIEPVKSVEFIYIPLRLKNTGEIAAL